MSQGNEQKGQESVEELFRVELDLVGLAEPAFEWRERGSELHLYVIAGGRRRGPFAFPREPLAGRQRLTLTNLVHGYAADVADDTYA